MMLQLLARIHAEQRAAGERVFPAASAEACAALDAVVHAQHGTALPPGYIDILLAADGLDFNGLVLYGTSRFIITNAEWHRDPALADWLVLGDTDMDLLAWHVPSAESWRLDRVSLDRIEHFATITDLLSAAMQERL